MHSPSMTDQRTDRNAIRRHMRRLRNALSPSAHQQAALAASSALVQCPLFQASQHIALYLPNDGELDLTPLLRMAQSRHKHCYLPVLHPAHSNRLWFLPYDAQTPLQRNRFGIPQPRARGPHHARPPWLLDLILAPLVAFDRQGHRLGMGGGYYDRTLAYLHHRKHWRKPHLIGTAHIFQEVETLSAAPWDVPLDAILTPNGIRQFGKQR